MKDNVSKDIQIFESPRSLQDVCIDFICDNIVRLSEMDPEDASNTTTCTSLALPQCDDHDEAASNSGTEVVTTLIGCNLLIDRSSNTVTKLRFKYPEAYLPAEVSERLLFKLSEKKLLSNVTITLFSSKSTRLRHVRLENASTLSAKGLKVLKQHKIVNLVVNGLKVTITDLISSLGEWSLQNLKSLSIAKGRFGDCASYLWVVTLCELKSLHTLNVSGTDFDDCGLLIVADGLRHLKNLDISCTKVKYISPLYMCPGLTSLIMYNLDICGEWIPVIYTLSELRHLDISMERINSVCLSKQKLADFLEEYPVPSLISLDLSGRNDINTKDITNSKCCIYLRFIGLVLSDACYDSSFTNPTNKKYRPDLVVSGTATEDQILEALRRYLYRPTYIQKCLINLFRLTTNLHVPQEDTIKAVLPAMEKYPHNLCVQMTGTACIYNLTKGKLATMIHPTVLKQIVEAILLAMESFPKHYQLQKHSLFVLCSDRILQDVPFDKYRCAKLILESLSTFDDVYMNRMSVAICSILAGKISTTETSMLGACPQYMSKMLAMLKLIVSSKAVDITMKFTLSALWNLTDESAATSEVFVNTGGVELFLDILEMFQGECSVKIKVLGLLNNVAEVPSLRPRLMQHRFITMISQLMNSLCIDVSYFSAGIVAHLLSDRACSWTSMPPQLGKQQLSDQLAYTVTHWQNPYQQVVAYRSFKPFFPLLHCKVYPSQLWALWAVHHVCTNNPKRYCSMLATNDTLETLRCLQNSPIQHTQEPNVQSLCRAILATVEANLC